MMLRIALVLLLAVAPLRAHAQSEAALAKVHRIFELTGMLNLIRATSEQAMAGMTTQIAAANPGRGAEIQRIVREHFLPEFQRRLPELIEETAKLQALTFTEEELDGLVAFYESPLGAKVIEKTPLLMQQNIAMGQAWGQRVATDVLEQMKPVLREKNFKI
jgi:hypothetical protein